MPCFEGNNYDSYLLEHITKKMLTLYNCTVAFNPGAFDQPGRTLPICNYSQAKEAQYYYESMPTTAYTLWSSQGILLVFIMRIMI